MIQLSHPYMATEKPHKIQTLPVQEVKILPQEETHREPISGQPLAFVLFLSLIISF